MNTLTENQITDIAIRITDKLVEMGYVPNCIDTDDNYEFDVQDMVSETIGESLNKLTLNLELYHAKCDECGSGMNEGYCIFGGHYYYCSDECLHKHFTEEEWLDLYEDGGDSYWTEWECEEDANYKLVNGELIEL
jgi:hypothetical protein